jgi:MioC protein
MKIAVLYGTETGTAEMLADDLVSAIEAEHDASVADLANTTPEALRGVDLSLLLCSTYGEGELPASARDFAQKLLDGADLEGVKFALFGLGDSTYAETFNNGSARLSTLMLGAGAKLIGKIGLYDAKSGDLPEEHAIPWAREVIAEIWTRG